MDGKIIKRSGRKTLNTLQIAVGRTDKENLTRRVIPKKIAMKDAKSSDKKTKKTDVKQTVNNKNELNKNLNDAVTKETENPKSIPITGIELTSDHVSDNYWKQLAEQRRVALDETLKENKDLHNRMTELEYENKKLKEMLEEAKSLVQVLTEMLEENEGNAETTEADETNEPAESDLEDVSFRSCV